MTATYNGTTAGSTSQNPPSVVAQVMMGDIDNSPGLKGGRIWYYHSTNFSSDIEGGGTPVILDGLALGMKAGDLLIGVQATAASVTPFTFITPIIAVTTAGAAISTNVISSTHA